VAAGPAASGPAARPAER